MHATVYSQPPVQNDSTDDDENHYYSPTNHNGHQGKQRQAEQIYNKETHTCIVSETGHSLGYRLHNGHYGKQRQSEQIYNKETITHIVSDWELGIH